MTQQTVNIGTTGNDRTGDKLRIAFGKINSNFNEVYANDVAIASNAAAAFNQANAAFNRANLSNDVAYVLATSIVANAAYNTANAAFNYANTIIGENTNLTDVFTVANAAFSKANTSVTDFSPAFNKANDAYHVANAAFNYANTIIGENTNLTDVFNVANSAFGAANTVSGNLSNYVLASDLSNTLSEYVTTPLVNAAFDVANAAFGAANNINVANIYINDLADVDINYGTISSGYVLKWDGSKWAAAVDATSGGGGAEADTLDGQHGSYYLDYNNFTNTPNLSVYATTTNVVNSLISANNYAGQMANAANSYAASLSPDLTAANNYAGVMANSVNAYTSATYATISSLGSYATVTNTEAAFDKANSANVLAYNTGIGANAYADTVGTNANNYANATFVKLTAGDQTITGNLSITGNLTLLGGSTIISSNNLSVGDSLIYLAANNYSGTDLLDIGFIANYGNTTGANVHTGLVRDATNKTYYLFNGYDKEPANNTFVPGSNNMTNAVLVADFNTSNLTLGGANAITWITSAYNTANASNGYSASVGAASNAWANTILTNGTSNTTFNNVSATNMNVDKFISLGGSQESIDSYSSVTGVTTFNCANSYIFYVTPSGNFTANLTNFTLDTNNVTSITMVLNQGVTPYMSINNLLIGAANLSINWQGGTAPTGTASKKDVLTLSILNVNGANTVLGQLVSFG